MNSELHFDGIGTTHLGLVRKNNEDRFLVNNTHSVYGVADGIGGLPMGEKASECAIRVLSRLTSSSEFMTTHDIVVNIHEATRQIGSLLKHPAGIGTTLSFLRINKGICEFGHVGDSAIFLIRTEEIIRLSPTHTTDGPSVLVAKNAEEMTSAERFKSRKRLERYVGQKEPLAPSVFSIRAAPEDRILICSDGIADALTEDEIIGVARVQRDKQLFLQGILAMVMLRGGRDNATAVIVDVST